MSGNLNNSIKHTTTTPEIKEKEPKKLKGNKLSIGAVLLAMLSGSPSAEFIAPITIGTSTALVTACGEKQLNIEDKKPTIDLKISTIDITGGKKVNIENNTLYIGGQKVATWSDNETKNCTVTLLLNGERILSGDTISKPGTLTLQVMDGAQQSVSKTIQLTETIVNGAPTIDVKKPEVDVSQGKEVIISDDKLTIGGEEVATWSDDRTKKCEVTLSFDGKEVKSGDILKDAGTLTLTVTDEEEKSDTKTIKLNVVNNEPVIKVEKEQLNIYGGATVNVSDNQLKLGDELMASWSDDRTENCKVTLMFNGSEVKSGDTLDLGGQPEGKLVLTISDGEGKSSSVEFTLTNETTEAISGLENLQSLNLKVEKEVNLIQGLTFANGVSLKKVEVEINGVRTSVQDPTHYTPEYPGDITIILTVDNNGVEEIKEVTITCAPLDYIAPSFNSVDYINQQYSWFNVMSRKSKEFIRGHLLTSYVNAEWFRKDNMVYIIMGEAPENYECEDIANSGDSGRGPHADEGFRRYRQITPTSKIKACTGSRSILEQYVNQHPNLDFIVSCAVDPLGGESLNKEDPNYKALKRLLEKEHITFNMISGNVDNLTSMLLNENQPRQEGGLYLSSSVNSGKNNKNTIVGYNPNQDNVFLYHNESLMPYGEGFGPGNRVFPFIAGLFEDINREDDATTSSYPTAAASSTQGNFLSILKSNYPGTTLEDANTILINKYYIEQPYYYKDTDGSIKEGGKWYFIDVNKFINEEILHKSSVEAIQLNSDDVELPSFPGLCYEGYGIQFECDGKRYDCTEDSKLINLIKQKKTIKWFSNKKRFLQYGGKGVADIKVFYLNTNGEIIPDLQINNISKSVN